MGQRTFRHVPTPRRRKPRAEKPMTAEQRQKLAQALGKSAKTKGAEATA